MWTPCRVRPSGFRDQGPAAGCEVIAGEQQALPKPGSQGPAGSLREACLLPTLFKGSLEEGRGETGLGPSFCCDPWIAREGQAWLSWVPPSGLKQESSVPNTASQGPAWGGHAPHLLESFILPTPTWPLPCPPSLCPAPGSNTHGRNRSEVKGSLALSVFRVPCLQC